MSRERQPTSPRSSGGGSPACPTTGTCPLSSSSSSSSNSSGAAPIIEIILDRDKDYIVDETDPTTDFVRVGLWDAAYDAAGNIKNAVAEADNFVGADTRRFYFRVRDIAAAASQIEVNWKTLRSDETDDDAPGSQTLTLSETAAGSKIFVSKAVFLVTDDTDRDQPTNSGLAAPHADAGDRNYGQSNHRTRRGSITGFVKGEYTPGSGGAAVTVKVPIFKRSPDERKRLSLRVINYGSHATAAYISGQVEHANSRWNQIGLQIDAQPTTDRPIPPAALDAASLYAGSLDNAFEQAALNDLIPVTPDASLTVVFVPLSGANAYATVGQRTTVTLGDRYFIFVDTSLSFLDETLAHELAHVLFNRFDDTTDQRYYTLNTNPPSGFGFTLPDVRIYRRIQNLHAADPDNDAANDNIINWARRARGARFPITSPGLAAPSATTGNGLIATF